MRNGLVESIGAEKRSVRPTPSLGDHFRPTPPRHTQLASKALGLSQQANDTATQANDTASYAPQDGRSLVVPQTSGGQATKIGENDRRPVSVRARLESGVVLNLGAWSLCCTHVGQCLLIRTHAESVPGAGHTLVDLGSRREAARFGGRQRRSSVERCRLCCNIFGSTWRLLESHVMMGQPMLRVCPLSAS